jgi:asparagine synthase (glutamine-hydrolysing)
MCGICGIYHLDHSRAVDRQALTEMTRVISHRGPDDEDFFVSNNLGLGHRRLSIIDLSALGRQPMSTEDGRFWIVFNGEIYNYLELRQFLVGKGYHFKSHSDTEVLLRLYQEEGSACVSRLNGMFAFAIWDQHERTLFAARDHFGIKPFYFAQVDGTFIFASEIKALLKSRLLSPELNHAGLTDYLTFQFCLEDKTLFRHVRKLLPGHCLTLKPDGELQIRQYWDLDFTIDTQHTAEYFEHQLLRLLEDSVRLQLRADVPVGAYLSGGLDSSTIACLASSLLDSPIHTFSGGFRDGPQYDETYYARIVADHARTVHHEIFPTAEDFVEIMPKLLYHMDEPAAGPGVFPQFFVSMLASRNVKVVMGGQGGDEVFGGYTRYLIAYLEECIRGGINGTQDDSKYVVTFDSILPNLTQLQGYQPLLRYFWQDGLFDVPEKRYFRLVNRSDGVREMVSPEVFNGNGSYDPFDAFVAEFNGGNVNSYINRMTRFDMKTLLPALLQVEDRMSMAVSLESRVPLLDHRIAELVASMPPMIKYEGGRSKHIFRKVVEHVTPTPILERKDKMGFPVPLSEWYRQGPVRDFVRETLLGQKARSRGFFDAKQIELLLDSEKAYGRGLWGILSLELWMQAFLDGNM